MSEVAGSATARRSSSTFVAGLMTALPRISRVMSIQTIENVTLLHLVQLEEAILLAPAYELVSVISKGNLRPQNILVP